jgi:quinol monooxygenase YgiN
MRTILRGNENRCQIGLDYGVPVLVVNRFRVPAEGAEAFRADLEAAHGLLAAREGYLDGVVGRNVDEPDLWVLTTRWVHVGAYRRALSSYDVKLGAVPLLSRALDEPSAYEVVEPGGGLNEAGTRRRPEEGDGGARREGSLG